MTTETPTIDQMETAMSVLLWLHGWCEDGAARDDVSHVRHILDEVIEGQHA